VLETLRIRNYALIDELEVELGKGLNVLTGETGAGKSIVVGALELVLGGRASAEMIRDGSKQARVDAVFRLSKPSRRLIALLKNHDLEWDGGELVLSRVITAEGRSRAYVSGSLVLVSLLAEIGDELVDLHGQHEHQSLLKPDRQIELLDAFAGTEEMVREVGEKVAQWRAIEKTIAELEMEDRDRARRMDYLRHETHEIHAAGLQPGEEEDLRSRRNWMANAERIFSLASGALATLYESEEMPAITAVDAALADLQELARIDDRFQAMASRLSGVRAEIEECAAELRAYSNRLEFDPAELDRINDRLSLLSDLKRKYGGSVEAVIAYYEKASAELEAFDTRDHRLAELTEKRDAIQMELRNRASELSQKRHAAGRRLDKLVMSVLHELGMKGGLFETSIRIGGLTHSGMDQVEFLLAANPGEKPRPLRQVASGGEISRIMLALKAVFAEADRIPTLVFDEIDAGVGGKIARNVAEKLRGLAVSHQTICITHLPQIAASAEHHFYVSKETILDRNVTTLQRAEGLTRIQEVARLLDGSVSEASLRHAKELIKEMGPAGKRS